MQYLLMANTLFMKEINQVYWNLLGWSSLPDRL